MKELSKPKSEDTSCPQLFIWNNFVDNTFAWISLLCDELAHACHPHVQVAPKMGGGACCNNNSKLVLCGASALWSWPPNPQRHATGCPEQLKARWARDFGAINLSFLFPGGGKSSKKHVETLSVMGHHSWTYYHYWWELRVWLSKSQHHWHL